MANIEKLIACLKHCAGNGDCLQCDRWTLNIEYECIDDLLLSAAIALEEKQATSNNGKQWIPVTERLPEHKEVVLVCGIRGGIYTAYCNRKYKNPGWHKMNSKNHYCDPTHWMPLPDLPKEAE